MCLNFGDKFFLLPASLSLICAAKAMQIIRFWQIAANRGQIRDAKQRVLVQVNACCFTGVLCESKVHNLALGLFSADNVKNGKQEMDFQAADPTWGWGRLGGDISPCGCQFAFWRWQWKSHTNKHTHTHTWADYPTVSRRPRRPAAKHCTVWVGGATPW